MISRCKARNPVMGNFEHGTVIGRSRDGFAYLVLFDDGAKGWVNAKYVFSYDPPPGEREAEQERLI